MKAGLWPALIPRIGMCSGCGCGLVGCVLSGEWLPLG